jgi:uncharacterized protein (DUF885 family)
MTDATATSEVTPKSENSNQEQIDLAEKLKQLEATNARLLEESKKNKTKSKEALTELEKIQQSTLEKEGDLQKILEAERIKNAELAEKLNSVKAKTLRANMMATLAKHASEVHDLDDLVNQPKFFSMLKDGMDEETLELREDVAKEYIKKVLEAKPWLKKSSTTPGAVTTRPGFKDVSSKTISEMTKDEIEEQLRKLYK